MTLNLQVTRWPNGATDQNPGGLLENLKRFNPATYHSMFDDFDSFTAANWVVTETDPAATEAVGASDGGILTLTNSAALNDLVSLQWAGGTGAALPTFTGNAANDLVFACSFAVLNALNAAFLVGFAVPDTSPIASLPTSGMFIHKPAAVLYPQGYIRQASVGQFTAQADIPMADATFYEMAIVYTAIDGVCTFYIGSPGGKTASQFRVAAPPTVPTSLLMPTIALQNGTAAAQSMFIDWFFAAKARRTG